MLSRIAESLFWIGRYVERAEATARILDVHIHHLLEAQLESEAELCAVLLSVMGVKITDMASEELTARRVVEILAFDTTNPSSIVSSLVAARVNARGVSEAISSEMWEALNVTYNTLFTESGHGSAFTPYAFFRFVRERGAVVSGLIDSTMSRDDAWRFMVLGRSLERVDMLARLLAAATVGPEPDWVVLLRSVSAHEAFLRTYRREPEGHLAAQFLLLDRLFPRSAFYSLRSAEECLAELDPRSARVGTQDEGRRVLGRLRTTLEFLRVSDLMSDLPELLPELQRECGAASVAIASRYFRQTNVIEWTVERAEFDVVQPIGL